MRDKVIRETHYDYTNKLIKIIGFKNLSDFESEISYKTLKSNQEKICTEINKLIDEFKKIFPQEGFNLRKINYKFENIDQVIGFLKKIFNYLSITWNYSRKNGIPVLRLISPNNLYNKYIMNLRNLPQKSDFLAENKTKLTFANANTNTNDCTDTNLKITENTNVFTIADIKPKQKFTELMEKFDKKPIMKQCILGNKFNVNLIQMDWVNHLLIKKINGEEIKTLPENTIISLINSEEEIILHKLTNLKNENIEIPIDLPNNFLYPDDNIYLKITLPVKKLENGVENLIDEQEFEIEFSGYNILNKTSLFTYSYGRISMYDCDIFTNGSDFDIDQGGYFSKTNFSFNISNGKFKILLNNCLENDANTNTNTNIITKKIGDNNRDISMKYIMGYLKKPFEKKYIIGNFLNLEDIAIFHYLKWIKIRTDNKNKLSDGIKLQLSIENKILLEYKINPETNFDPDNYYKFEINFPNKYLLIYEELHFNIISDNKNDLTHYDIIVNGCDFRSTTPKTLSMHPINNIVLDHDEKWYKKGEIEYICIHGKVNIFYPNLYKNESDTLLEEEFKKYQDKNIVDIFNIKMPWNDEKNIRCLFIDSNLNDVYNDNDNKIHHVLMFLVKPEFKNYLKKNNLIESDDFCIGSNNLVGTNRFCDICEVINKKSIKLHYKIKKFCGDMLRYIDLGIKNYSKSNKYNINAQIECSSGKIMNLELVYTDKSLRLMFPNKKILDLLKNLEGFSLLIEIPESKFSDWKNIDISFGTIYLDNQIRLVYLDQTTKSNLDNFDGLFDSEII